MFAFFQANTAYAEHGLPLRNVVGNVVGSTLTINADSDENTCGGIYQMQVEIRKSCEPFTGQANYFSATWEKGACQLLPHQPVSIDLSVFGSCTYKWRAREVVLYDSNPLGNNSYGDYSGVYGTETDVSGSTVFTSTPTVNLTPACVNSVVKVTFTANSVSTVCCPVTYRAELSDASGSFSEPTNLGAVVPGINNVTIPQYTPTGTGYRVRIVASSGTISNVSAAFRINQPYFPAAPTVSLDNKCAGQAVRMSFSIACTFFEGNTFTAELSNSMGSFAAPVSLGTVTPGAMNNVVIPMGTLAGTGYKIRIVSSNPMVTSPASANFKVKACGGVPREAAPEDLGLQVGVSPNPSPEGRLRIHVSGVEGQALKVALFNGTGQPVREQDMERAGETETLDWDISRQPAGLYLLRVSGAKEAKTVKVVH